MALVPIEQIGQVGIIKDPPAYSIPPNAWSDGSNVEFTDQGVQNIEGYYEVMKECPIQVHHLVCYLRTDKSDLWVAFGASSGGVTGKIYSYGKTPEEDSEGDEPNWLDVTPLSTGEGSTTLYHSYSTVWSTTFLGAQLVAANGNDPAVYWPLMDDPTSETEENEVVHGRRFKLLDLNITNDGVTDWEEERGGPVPKAIKSFKSILIGMNYPNAPTRVWWSSAGGHYTLPTWDWSNKDQDAGDYELLDTQGAIVDGAALGEAFLIYKEDSIYIASYIGRPFIFGFKALTKDVGLLTKNALASYPGGHIFMSRYDVHITNGQSIQSLLSDKLQGEVFKNISGEAHHHAFISVDWARNQAYICYPSANSEWCDKAIIWNWDTGVLSVRSIPQLSDMKQGVIENIKLDTWENQVETWSTIGSREWGRSAFDKVHPELVFSSPSQSKIRQNAAGLHTLDGGPMQAVVERIGLDLGDPGSVKKVNAVWPKISTTGDDNTVDISLCSQMSPDDPVKWEGPYKFNPNTMSKVSCRITGKYFGWKIESDGYLRWRCHGVEFNVEPGGQRGSRVQ